MSLKYKNLYFIDLGESLHKFNDVIKSRKQGDMAHSVYLEKKGKLLDFLKSDFHQL